MNYPGEKKLVEMAMELVTDWDKEHLVGVFIGADTKVKHVELLGIGTMTNTPVHPREVFRPAVRWASCGVVLLHNHPVDDIQPSDMDIAASQRVYDAGKLLGIPLVDHIVFNKKREFYSFRTEGDMKKLKLESQIGGDIHDYV